MVVCFSLLNFTRKMWISFVLYSVSSSQERERYAQYDDAVAKIATLENSLSLARRSMQDSSEVGGRVKEEFHDKVSFVSVVHCVTSLGIHCLLYYMYACECRL